jgi:hypothetical protein
LALIEEKDDAIPSILLPVEDPELGGDGSSKEYRRNWACLIQKIYETDPLCCPKCQGQMKVKSVLTDHNILHLPDFIEKRLNSARAINTKSIFTAW